MDKASVSTVGIVGVSGYSGIELARIVAGHPRLALTLAISDKWAGSTLGEPPGPAGGAGGDAEGPPAEGRGDGGGVRGAGRRLPVHAGGGVAGARAGRAGGRRAGRRPVRAPSGSPRMNIHAGTVSQHGRPDLLPAACYSMPEAGALGRHPRGPAGVEPRLLRHGQHAGGAGAAARRDHRHATGIIIDAASGTTGAGRKASEDFSFSEVDGDFRAYRVLTPPAHARDRAGPGPGGPAAGSR